MEIIVDDRERAVFDYLEECSHNSHINYKIQRNEVGDYAITYKGYILLIIERKTWVDLAASLRDGRKENVNKLIALREKTGCQIGYLIEGDATPSFDKKFGRMPLKNLRSHLDHLSFRDGIHMFYSKNLEYTANRLFELAQNYLTLKDIIKEIDTMAPTANDDSLQQKQVKNLGMNEQLLRCIPGIGSIISTVLAEAGITLANLYLETYELDSIAKLKYASGSFIGIEKAKKICKIKSIIDSNSVVNNTIKTKILMCVPLITKCTADKILSQVSLSSIINGETPSDTIANIYKTEKTRVGDKAAQNILQAFRTVGIASSVVSSDSQLTYAV
jgi:ERCC4-type nuclease